MESSPFVCGGRRAEAGGVFPVQARRSPTAVASPAGPRSASPAAAFAPDTILYGASYYREYMPYERLEKDVRADGESRHHLRPRRRVHLGRAWSRATASSISPGSTGSSTECTRPGSRSSWARRPIPSRPGSSAKHPEIQVKPINQASLHLRPAPDDRPHAPRLPALRRAHHPQARLALQGPPGRHRLPARQRDPLLGHGRRAASRSASATASKRRSARPRR